MEFQILEKIGIFGTLVFLIWKQYEKKDTQQNTQNDLLVQNLMESNRKKDELLERTVVKFEEGMKVLTEKIGSMDSKVGRIEQQVSQNSAP